jgi:hypothetical protein
MLLLASIQSEAQDPAIADGVLKIQSSLKGRKIGLDGYWGFYPNELVDGSKIIREKSVTYVNVPGWWTEKDNVEPVQYGTYRLKMILQEQDLHQSWALYMPDVYSAYDLFIDGKKIGTNGEPGVDKVHSKPTWKPETYIFTPTNDTTEILIHISNFHHFRTGIREHIYIGDSEILLGKKNQTYASNALLFFGLLLFSVASFVLFAIKRNSPFLFYALLCISWALRSIFSNYYLSSQWFPNLSWNVSIVIEYITLYFSTLSGALLIGSLFPSETKKTIRYFFVVTCLCFTIFTLVVEPVLFTRFVNIYLGLSTVLLIWIVTILFKAYIESRQGASFLIICTLIGVLMFAYVILSYQGLFELNELFFNIGFLGLFFLAAIAMVRRLAKMSSTYDYDRMTFNEVIKNRK